ncbi:uncharacterized protein VTP21DRAFT_8699 [Calcarisporiella thermophila]|uniref:uncharacterized protein n=1 Tax=Calcarisporiella thermophila TaxID=911321 RepID=UPI00374434DD
MGTEEFSNNNYSNTLSTSIDPLSSTNTSIGAFVGSIIGGVIAAVLLVAVTSYLLIQSRRRKTVEEKDPPSAVSVMEEGLYFSDGMHIHSSSSRSQGEQPGK